MIAYYKCVSVATVTQHAVRMRPIVICVLSGCTIFFHISRKRHDLGGKQVIQHEMCVLTFSTTSV